jgi:hypothetical protein
VVANRARKRAPTRAYAAFAARRVP